LARIRWKEQFEIVGMFAIVASLVFVGLQMQQDRHLMRAELGAHSQDFSATIDLSLGDPDVSSAWAKMLEHPEDLSLDEMVRVDSVLAAARRLFLRECYLVAMDVFVECEGLIHGQATSYFGNKYAQSWWRARSDSIGSRPDSYGTREMINEIVTSIDVSANQSFLEETKEGM
jgi:hypothetical protein